MGNGIFWVDPLCSEYIQDLSLGRKGGWLLEDNEQPLTRGMGKASEAVSTRARESNESRSKNRGIQRKRRFGSEDDTWFSSSDDILLGSLPH